MQVLALGAKVKKRRKELDMTLKDVAGSKVTPGQISLVESGKSNPSMDLLEYLAKTLDISVEYLMESEATQAETICTYFGKMAEVHIASGDLEKGRFYIEESESFIEGYDLVLSRARNLYLKALYEIQRGDYTKAFDYLFQCNVIYATHGHKAGFLDNFILVGKTFLNVSSLPLAISYFHKSEALFTEGAITDELMLAKIYYYLALAYKRMGRIDRAKEYAAKANEKFQELSDRKAYGALLTRLAEEAEARGDLQGAMKFAEMALKVQKVEEEDQEEARMEENLGNLFMTFGNYPEAVRHLEKARLMYRTILGQRRVPVDIAIAECQAYMNQEKDCMETLRRLEAEIPEEDHGDMVRLHRVKAKVHGLLNHSREAMNHLILALNMAREAGLRKEESEVLQLLSKYHLDRGRRQEAHRYLDQALDVANPMEVDG